MTRGTENNIHSKREHSKSVIENMVAGVPQGTAGLQHKGFPGRGSGPRGITGCRWYGQFPHPPCLSFS